MTARPAAAPVTVTEICEKLWQAIFERKLRPGMRLKEEELAEIFSTSRARVRQALSLLERDRLVTLIPNRGGFVSEPTIDEARDVFFARRIVEGGLMERLCSRVTDADIARLRAHVALERDAHQRDDLPAMVRLSGAFHILIAELAGSEYLHGVLRDLVSRTSLISTMYQPRQMHDCGPDEHEEIVGHIARGDVAAALAAMAHHLEHVEAQLDLNEAPDLPRDLREALL
ncbi:transcriptional regulator, GntR family [Gemmobacter megaterium]|uniref:Transcriptional regulator, GntR family n=1 Tax=Gemmobacter megaterium TaxID=1086013 RepID=A0A1N7NEA0_9RHOB|nr:GntR family transcriptional regulator [Gemmobacter megaterium]GGE14579.1 GntR family transcriptional regulator [Gemmobacter megaterium]SIS96622.1 transcriptional regulator, GntR family [Gemmobacter megaterium]